MRQSAATRRIGVTLPFVDTALAIDIGGTKLAAGIVDGDGVLLHRAVAPTPSTRDPEALFAALLEVIRGLPLAAPVVCGAGCGGPMTRGGGEVSPLNIPAWRRFPLRGRLEEAIGLPVYVDNDAKALTLGEGWVGAAAGEENFIGMVVSTGVGGGIVLEGRLLDGADGNAGHIGHIVVEPGGRVCVCGSRGCLEAEASGTAIRAITGRPPSEAPAGVVARTGMLVGRAVATVANLLDLRLAVVAGSVALGFGVPFFEAAQREIDALCRLEFSAGTRIVPAGLGADAPLIGAAAVGFRGALAAGSTEAGAGD
jgi:glucokinase